jgi:hypothetical protein
MNKEMYIIIPRRFRDTVRRKRHKNGEPAVGFPFTAMLQHTGRFWSWIS